MANSKYNERLESYRKEVTEQLRGILKNREQFQQNYPEGMGSFYDPVTQEVFSGINRISLGAAANQKGYSDRRWVTYDEAKEAGTNVRYGEKSTKIEYSRPYDLKAKKQVSWAEYRFLLSEGTRTENDFRINVYIYNLFNAEQLADSSVLSTYVPEEITAENSVGERLNSENISSLLPNVYEGTWAVETGTETYEALVNQITNMILPSGGRYELQGNDQNIDYDAISLNAMLGAIGQAETNRRTIVENAEGIEPAVSIHRTEEGEIRTVPEAGASIEVAEETVENVRTEEQTVADNEKNRMNETEFRDRQIAEAVERMRILGTEAYSIEQFQEGIVRQTDEDMGWIAEASPYQVDKIRKFEEENGAVVYHVIHGYYETGLFDDLHEKNHYLYVSKYPDEWENDKRDIEEGKIRCRIEDVTDHSINPSGVIEYDLEYGVPVIHKKEKETEGKQTNFFEPSEHKDEVLREEEDLKFKEEVKQDFGLSRDEENKGLEAVLEQLRPGMKIKLPGSMYLDQNMKPVYVDETVVTISSITEHAVHYFVGESILDGSGMISKESLLKEGFGILDAESKDEEKEQLKAALEAHKTVFIDAEEVKRVFGKPVYKDQKIEFDPADEVFIWTGELLFGYQKNNTIQRFYGQDLDKIAAEILEKIHSEDGLSLRYEAKEPEKTPELGDIDNDEVLKKVLVEFGSGFENGKVRIHNYLSEKHSKEDAVAFLKKEFGVGGATIVFDERLRWMDHSGAGISVTLKDNSVITYSWNKVLETLEELVKNNEYLKQEDQKKTVFRVRSGAEYRIIDDFADDDGNVYTVGKSWDGDDFYAVLVNKDRSENVRPYAELEYDFNPDSLKIISDYTDYLAEQDFNRYEAEYGADGSRAFGRGSEENAEEALRDRGLLEEEPKEKKKEGKKRLHEDFGKKIGGARKDIWAARGLMETDLNEMNDAEKVVHVKKDNVWKKPDYQKMKDDDGIDPGVIYAMKLVRDALPVKSDSYFEYGDKDQYEGYVETIGFVRDKMMNCRSYEDVMNALSDVKKSELIKKTRLMNSWYGGSGRKKMFNLMWELAGKDESRLKQILERKVRNKSFLYSEDDQLKRYVRISHFETKNGEPNYQEKDGHFELKFMDEPFSTYFIYDTESVRKLTEAQLEGKYAGIHYGLNSDGNRSGYIVDYIGDDAAEAERAAIQAQKDIIASNPEQTEEDKKKRKEKYKPHVLDHVELSGADYRHGEHMKGEDLLEEFHFRGGEFGNWMDDKDRQQSLDCCYDSFMNIAKALNVKPEDITCGDRLSIAFGARGRGGSAVAHYEPEREVINITKMRGAGSLGHEWIHAQDDIFGKVVGTGGMMSENQQHAPEELKTLMSAICQREMTEEDIRESRKERAEKAEANVRAFFTDAGRKADPKIRDEYINKILKEFRSDPEYCAVLDITGRNIKYDTVMCRSAGEYMDYLKANNVGQPRYIEINAKYINGNLRANVASAYKAMKEPINMDQKRYCSTDYYKNAKKLDEMFSKDGHGYWSSSCELLARAGAVYLKDKLDELGIKDPYLCGHAEGMVSSKDGPVFLMPVGEDRDRINKAFDAYFDLLKEKGLLHEAQQDSLENKIESMRSEVNKNGIKEENSNRIETERV